MPQKISEQMKVENYTTQEPFNIKIQVLVILVHKLWRWWHKQNKDRRAMLTMCPESL